MTRGDRLTAMVLMFLVVAQTGCAASRSTGAPPAASPRPAAAAVDRFNIGDSAPRGTRGMFGTALSESGTPTTTLSAALTAAGPGVRLPSEAAAGRPERVLTLADGQKARVGLAVRYAGDVEVYVQPGRVAGEFLNYAPPSTWTVQFDDGRPTALEFVNVGQVRVAIQRGGAFHTASGASGVMPAVVSWHEGDVQFIVRSDEVGAERLLEVVRSMY